MHCEIICLANSYKHKGRCIAGIRTDTGQWIRLRSASDNGALTSSEYTLSGNGEVRLLDIFEVDLHYAMPSDCHPEDWVCYPRPWRLQARPCGPTAWNHIKASLQTGASIFGGYRDRLAAHELRSKPMKSSLAVIQPESLWWWIREEHGKRKNRALFHRNHITYDLPVTDPRWLDQLNLLPAGIYPHATIAPGARETFLTISLSEAFQPTGHGPAWHFRIVAGVLCR